MISMPITQGHLKLLETCPRRFQYSYLEHIPVPTAPAVLERQQWGTQFHLVMQQRELGLSVDAILAETPELELAVNRLLAAAPELFQPPQPDEFRQSEHRRQLAFNDYLLTVIYDLLIMTPHQAHIVDWKTYPASPQTGPTYKRLADPALSLRAGGNLSPLTRASFHELLVCPASTRFRSGQRYPQSDTDSLFHCPAPQDRERSPTPDQLPHNAAGPRYGPAASGCHPGPLRSLPLRRPLPASFGAIRHRCSVRVAQH
jgi:hypothetical protein